MINVMDWENGEKNPRDEFSNPETIDSDINNVEIGIIEDQTPPIGKREGDENSKNEHSDLVNLYLDMKNMETGVI